MVKRICDRCGAEINPTSSATYVTVRGSYYVEDVELCCSCGMRVREWLKPIEEGKKDV